MYAYLCIWKYEAYSLPLSLTHTHTYVYMYICIPQCFTDWTMFQIMLP